MDPACPPAEYAPSPSSFAVQYSEIFDPLTLDGGYYSVVLGMDDGLDSGVLAASEL